MSKNIRRHRELRKATKMGKGGRYGSHPSFWSTGEDGYMPRDIGENTPANYGVHRTDLHRLKIWKNQLLSALKNNEPIEDFDYNSEGELEGRELTRDEILEYLKDVNQQINETERVEKIYQKYKKPADKEEMTAAMQGIPTRRKSKGSKPKTKRTQAKPKNRKAKSTMGVKVPKINLKRIKGL